MILVSRLSCLEKAIMFPSRMHVNNEHMCISFFQLWTTNKIMFIWWVIARGCMNMCKLVNYTLKYISLAGTIHVEDNLSHFFN